MPDQPQNKRVIFSGVPEGFDGRVIADITKTARTDDQPGLHLHVARDVTRCYRAGASLVAQNLRISAMCSTCVPWPPGVTTSWLAIPAAVSC